MKNTLARSDTGTITETIKRRKRKEDLEIEEIGMERKKPREITDKTAAQKAEYKVLVKTVMKRRD